MINAILIDDESHNRSVLRELLSRHCPDVNCVAEAASVDEAHEQIAIQKPQLVFLDIKMPGGSGFDLLRRFERIDFEVIFVSGFNEYAISAFEFNAVDYILKPIDYQKLQMAVTRAEKKIATKTKEDNLFVFLQTLDQQSDVVQKIPVHDRGRVILIPFGDISYIKADSDSTEIYLSDCRCYFSSKSIKQFEEVLVKQAHFIRINKSIMVNTHRIASYTKGEYCLLVLDSGEEFEVSRRKKAEVLSKLKKAE